jgi:CheY-like chemotaxis protein
MRILLLDDELFNLKGLKSFITLSLKRLNHRPDLLASLIDIVSNGEEGLKMAKEKLQENSSYALVITDCQMPIMDGYSFSLKLRQLYLEEEVE